MSGWHKMWQHMKCGCHENTPCRSLIMGSTVDVVSSFVPQIHWHICQSIIECSRDTEAVSGRQVQHPSGPTCIMVSRTYPTVSLIFLMQVHLIPSWISQCTQKVYLLHILLEEKPETTRVKRKIEKIRMSRTWDINGRPNHSSVNMKLCNTSEKTIREEVWFEDGCSKSLFPLSLECIRKQ